MKQKQILLYGGIILSFCFTLVSIILFGVYASFRCSVTVNGTSVECDASSYIDNCLAIFGYSESDGDNSTSFYCPWYDRDVGIGETALSLVFIFVALFALRKKFNDASYKKARLGCAYLGLTLLFVTIILMFVDLTDATLPDEEGLTRAPYIANGIMVIFSFICVSGLTYKDTKKYMKKKGTKVHKAEPVPVISP